MSSKVNVLHMLLYGITVSKGFRVNVFDKMGYHTGLRRVMVLGLPYLTVGYHRLTFFKDRRLG